MLIHGCQWYAYSSVFVCVCVCASFDVVFLAELCELQNALNASQNQRTKESRKRESTKIMTSSSGAEEKKKKRIFVK